MQSAQGTGTQIFSQRETATPVAAAPFVHSPNPTRPDQARLGQIEERERERHGSAYCYRQHPTTLPRRQHCPVSQTHTHTYHGVPHSPALLGLGSFPLFVPPFPSPVADFIVAVSFRFLSNVWLNDGIDGWITRKR